ncbi:hypothetical protein MIMGU_mgv1a020445mg [Erythranthe guttata]|uniref:Uncharacterized protein n=1 Tax=Erythranthe guttata TaxID=4155 RepID=A0A022QMP8_ERYGU|nr:hypothetical protein MIMGU_mgv1a020445mg [Erythranthe guttata]
MTKGEIVRIREDSDFGFSAHLWCWKNSINAKSLRRCQNTVLEMEGCLQNEMNLIVSNYWYWKPQTCSAYDKKLKNIILSSLPENVAIEKNKWGRVTFLTPDAAEKVVVLNKTEFCGGLLEVIPFRSNFGGDQRMPSLIAKISWPRDVPFIVNDLSNLLIGGRIVWCEASTKFRDSVVLRGLDRDLSDDEILPVLHATTNRWIKRFSLIRGNVVDKPSPVSCGEVILRELNSFMPKRNPWGSCVSIKVFAPELDSCFVRANITFDGSLHLEAARALEQIDGKALQGFHSWQKIRVHEMFHSSVYCPAPVYFVL